MERQTLNFWAFEERHPFLTLWLILLVVAVVLVGMFGVAHLFDVLAGNTTWLKLD